MYLLFRRFVCLTFLGYGLPPGGERADGGGGLQKCGGTCSLAAPPPKNLRNADFLDMIVLKVL